MQRIELTGVFVHSKSGKPELLNKIDLALAFAPKPEPKDGFSQAETIKFPKSFRKNCVETMGLAGNYTMERPIKRRTWSLYVGGVFVPDSAHDYLSDAKAWAAAYLLGKLKQDGEVEFTSTGNGTIFTIPNSVYHLENFRKVVKRSVKTNFYKDR